MSEEGPIKKKKKSRIAQSIKLGLWRKSCIFFRLFFNVRVNNTARAHTMGNARTVVPHGKIIRAKVTQIDLSRVVH